MADKDDIDKKLDEVDKKFNIVSIRKHYKARLLAKINAGEIGLLEELQKLEQMERGELPGAEAPKKPHQDEEEEPAPQIGIPSHLRIPRRYTLSAEARAQRAKAAKARKPKNRQSLKGNKNAYKHGQFAQGAVEKFMRPCKSTCPDYPCEIVLKGGTKAGDDCLDFARAIAGYRAIIDAVKDGSFGDFNDLGALTMGNAFQVVNMLLEDILRDGTMAKKEKYDKFGGQIGYEIVPHPSLLALPKLFEKLGVTPQEFLITPASIAKNKTDKKKAQALAEVLSSFGGGKPSGEDEEE